MPTDPSSSSSRSRYSASAPRTRGARRRVNARKSTRSARPPRAGSAARTQTRAATASSCPSVTETREVSRLKFAATSTRNTTLITRTSPSRWCGTCVSGASGRSTSSSRIKVSGRFTGTRSRFGCSRTQKALTSTGPGDGSSGNSY